MSGEKDRESAAGGDAGTAIPGSRPEEIQLMSGEALDDDELDELCDATLASIGEIKGRQPA